MKTISYLPLCGALVGIVSLSVISNSALAEEKVPAKAAEAKGPITWTSGGKPSKKMDVLYVQNAKKATLKDGKLVLSGVGGSTICFTDRPARLAGHLPTAEFIPLWSEGKDSFLKDPPNATLSIFGGGKVSDLVVEISNPVLKGNTLTYDAKVLEGDASAKGECALFIDIIGMPRTPMSYAGVARRSFRRGIY